jgi:hypothetical protein
MSAAMIGYRAQLDGLDARLQALGLAADASERALLTSQGETLKALVAKALRHLGFAVEDIDAARPQGDKLEDLRVKNSDQDEDLVLVEVRGYKGGAQLSDLMRMQRFAMRFHKDEGHLPHRLWYVVNHSLAEDPGQRAPALASNPTEVEAFADSDGLVVDAVELFKVWKAVDAGILDSAQARAMMIEATGRFLASVVIAGTAAVLATEPSV